MEAQQPFQRPPQVTEDLQGLYGTFKFPEKLIQKIWNSQNFLHHNLHTTNKQTLSVTHPGTWNSNEGPDFLNAQLIIDNKPLCGDVEIHFHPNDWFAHNHHTDSNFSNTVLHVCLFHPKPSSPLPYTNKGTKPELLVLLPYLHHSLEEYATEEALSNITSPELIEPFATLSYLEPEERQHKLISLAKQRWQQKRAHAAMRLKNEGYTDACHQMTLEVLGYRRNRSPMNAIGIHYNIHHFAQQDPAALFEQFKPAWKLSGTRPQNHPLKRLQQYHQLVTTIPNWPERWENLTNHLPQSNPNLPTKTFRKTWELTKLTKVIQEKILANALSGTRLHTLLIDALLPLASAHSQKDLFPLWLNWYPGDCPSSVSDFFQQHPLPNQPLTNGLTQGALHALFMSNKA